MAGTWGGSFELSEDAAVYVISIAAELSGLHPQTLRQYDRLGLVSPTRTPGRGRRYSLRDIEQLREVQRLSQEQGINLAGIKRILELENRVDALRARVTELKAELEAARDAARLATREAQAEYRRDLVPVERNAALVVWRPPRR